MRIRSPLPTPAIHGRILAELDRKGELTTDDIACRLKEPTEKVSEEMKKLVARKQVSVAARVHKIPIWRKA